MIRLWHLIAVFDVPSDDVSSFSFMFRVMNFGVLYANLDFFWCRILNEIMYSDRLYVNLQILCKALCLIVSMLGFQTKNIDV